MIDGAYIQKRDGLRGESETFAWYMGFRGKWRPTGHRQSFKIYTLMHVGAEFIIFEAVLHERFFNLFSGWEIKRLFSFLKSYFAGTFFRPLEILSMDLCCSFGLHSCLEGSQK